MGKIRVTALGDETLEQKHKQEIKKRKEEKKLVKGAKGGERVVSVGPSEEELAKLSVSEGLSDSAVAREISDKKTATTETQKKKKSQKKKAQVRSPKYLASAKLVDRTKKYKLADALELLPKLKISKFDETVELHINTTTQGISGTVTLPHGTGKTIRVAIADDKIVSEVEKGKISFDVLLAVPAMMPKLARIAKFLGPRGLMPNPKNGTLTNDPEKMAENFTKGQIRFKTEAKSPIMHLVLGKLSFGPKKLTENINTIIKAIKKENIKNTALKSTMSPGIKLDLG